ncbi:MAG: gamma carbonic anhydrase family protein [Pseudomonadota bacterium]
MPVIRPYRDASPTVHTSAFVSESALVMGHVKIGEHCGVWPGAVIRGDFCKIEVSCNTIVEDNSVVHGGEDMTIGEHCVIGHGAVVHCRQIGQRCLIANNAVVLDGATLGDYCVVAAGCVVAPNMVVPSYSLVMGVPGKIRGRISDSQLTRLQQGNESYIEMFTHYREAGI